MIIALTGTPGTGKTTICNFLIKSFKIIDLNKLVIDEGLHFGQDEERGSLIADLDALNEKVHAILKDETSTVVIEGHLSHYLSGYDAIIILRTRPEVLGKRLETRGYTREKITENIEAEALDVILIEAVELNEKVYEVETTTFSPIQASLEIQSIIQLLEAEDFGQLEKYLPGRFDWSEEVFL
ncbi:MAG TPA: adenylate kinase family protein [Candidatus Nanoarchaeia archaeon]|nr:adenylate kinase family protein [Candidatus Nanoarchaeia archaeon]